MTAISRTGISVCKKKQTNNLNHFKGGFEYANQNKISTDRKAVGC